MAHPRVLGFAPKLQCLRLSAPLVVIVVALVLISFAPGRSHGQVEGTIAAHTGAPDFLICDVFDTGPAVRTVYIMHKMNPGATAVRFRIAPSDGMTMTLLSETHHFPSAGSATSGIAMCYGACAVGDQLLVTLTYMAYGTSSPCSKVLVVPHSAASTVEAIRCDGSVVATFVEDLWVSPSPVGCSGCPTPPHVFPGTPQSFACSPVPVAATTWGAIKSLYAN